MQQQGLILKSTGIWYDVLIDNKSIIQARLRGLFRLKGIKTTNPVVVGDNVIVDFSEKDNVYNIVEILDRKNYIIRKSKNLSKISHIIASNIDKALLVVTIKSPRTSTGFIDRFITAAEAYRIKVEIVFNKIDIYNDKDFDILSKFENIYKPLGYKCYRTSTFENIGIDDLKQTLKNSTSLIAGHSGVGKSAIINKIDINLDLKIGEISDYHQKGKHTTTFAQMHPLIFGGFIIDSPGIKEFGLIDYKKDEIGHYFVEFRERLNLCKFDNCTHFHEPGCQIKQAVENGEISEVRYQNYLSILTDDDQKIESWELE